MTIDDGREDAIQVAVWFDQVQFAGFDQRREHGPVLGTRVVSREERVLSLQRDGRMVRSTGLLSISMRPSVRNRRRPSQYLTMYLSATPVGDLVDTCFRA